MNDDEEVDADEISDLIVLQSPTETECRFQRVSFKIEPKLRVMSALYRPTWVEGKVDGSLM